ncbi:MAG: hypothetical protein KBA46_07515, partial [Candidatus Omnitrophica bacterium]|nr:hypothetical protein [Candidatus Omnitrophota bacterium]
MKNIIFALLILLLISVTGIQLYAAGEPNSLPDHCSPNAPAYLRDPIGCPCTTNWAEASAALPGLAPRDSDMIEPGDLYCYIPAGSYSARGTMRRCTVDQQAGKTGYDNPPCECRENRFDGSKRVFCRKNYCDSCQRSSDCPQGIPDSKDKSSCLMGKYFEKSKRCHTCKHIMGDGPIKVTLYFINLPPGVYDQIEAARGLVAGLLSIEPFG